MSSYRDLVTISEFLLKFQFRRLVEVIHYRSHKLSLRGVGIIECTFGYADAFGKL